jgi:aryl-alcohol dehydrogenase-like predicted oxidoreductase
MQTRKLGYTDLHLTTVGLGTWAIGGPWFWGWGPQDDNNSLNAISEALDQGINWIDTAPAYGLGHSEEIVGKAIKGKRDQLTIATKCGRVWDDPADLAVYPRLTAESVRKEAEASLRRLDVDVIDLYQIHWPQPDEDIEEGWTEIAKLIEEGKIRYGGVSNFSVSQLKRVLPIHPVASLQPPYSMVKREVEEELLPFCAKNQIGVVAYSPMQAGLLTGAFSRERVASLAADDWRKRNPEFLDPALGATLSILDTMRPVVERAGRNLAQLAVAWVLRRPELTAAIVGARKPGQISQTAPAGDWRLDEEIVTQIDELLAERDRILAEA